MYFTSVLFSISSIMMLQALPYSANAAAAAACRPDRAAAFCGFGTLDPRRRGCASIADRALEIRRLAVGTAASRPVEKNPNLFSAPTFSTHAPGRIP
jgi:hypothetical protein